MERAHKRARNDGTVERIPEITLCSEDHSRSLLQRLNALRESKTLCDVILHVDGEVLPPPRKLPFLRLFTCPAETPPDACPAPLMVQFGNPVLGLYSSSGFPCASRRARRVERLPFGAAVGPVAREQAGGGSPGRHAGLSLPRAAALHIQVILPHGTSIDSIRAISSAAAA